MKEESMEVEEEDIKVTAGVSKLDSEKPVTDKEEYEELCRLVNPISQPLANRKLFSQCKQAKKIYKLLKKTAESKLHLKLGLADVQKAIRTGQKGLVIFAGNVTPIDVYSHLPALCEEKDLPYIYTPSREHLGLACGHKRPAIVLLVKETENTSALYHDVCASIQSYVLEVASS